jgi:hypothetical protein
MNCPICNNSLSLGQNFKYRCFCLNKEELTNDYTSNGFILQFLSQDKILYYWITCNPLVFMYTNTSKTGDYWYIYGNSGRGDEKLTQITPGYIAPQEGWKLLQRYHNLKAFS